MNLMIFNTDTLPRFIQSSLCLYLKILSLSFSHFKLHHSLYTGPNMVNRWIFPIDLISFICRVFHNFHLKLRYYIMSNCITYCENKFFLNLIHLLYDNFFNNAMIKICNDMAYVSNLSQYVHYKKNFFFIFLLWN